MNSVWSENTKLPVFKTLSGNISTDILIIGGGIAGVLLAYNLHNLGADYVLVDAGKICGKITKNTTAKITAGHGLIYDSLFRRFGREKAEMYFRANETAVDEYREICKNVDCDFEDKDSYVYSVKDSNKTKIKREVAALRALGANAKYTERTELPFSISGAVKLAHQAQFNPLKFVGEICTELNIYEHTNVRELIGTVAFTENGKICAKRIVIATHFPILNKHGSYFLKMYQHRSYVAAFEGAAEFDGIYVDENDRGMSFRNYGDLLLIGGGGHRTGKNGGAWREIEAFAAKYYPAARVKYRFATQDCITLDGVPYIGEYSGGTENLYVATGFNKWGMTSAMVAADILSDMLDGRKNPNAAVFNPSRTILRPNLAVNAYEAATGIIGFKEKRCPHLGCALKWNRSEHTWDCPCHGSRFTKDGRVIDNPATGDLQF